MRHQPSVGPPHDRHLRDEADAATKRGERPTLYRVTRLSGRVVETLVIGARAWQTAPGPSDPPLTGDWHEQDQSIMVDGAWFTSDPSRPFETPILLGLDGLPVY